MREPGIGPLDLPAILDLLRKESAIVADAVAIGGQPEIGHAVEQARGQPSQAAIAERGIGLELDEGVEIDAMLGQHVPAAFVEAEILQGVDEKPARQELHRKVVDPLCAGIVGAVGAVAPLLGDPVAYQSGECREPLLRRCRLRWAAGQGAHIAGEGRQIT